METKTTEPRSLLRQIARRAMTERGLLPDFSPGALAELSRIQGAAADPEPLRDLRHLLWCSIDNDESRDLDQLTAAEALPDGAVKLWVAIADVDALVPKGSQLDQHAQANTTSVYTVAQIFPMLPEKLSTDLTSLKDGAERSAVVVEMIVSRDGSPGKSEIYPARVFNRAKLAYGGVAAWLSGAGPMPAGVSAIPGLADNLRLQEKAAERMKTRRHECGALTLETIETRMTFDDGRLKDLEAEKKNLAKEMIEDFMIAANGATARFLASNGFASLRRVVKTPKRWDRIVEIASERRFTLPPQPDAKALEGFLTASRRSDPDRFPDLSLSIIKLLGPGEYTVELPGERSEGHFGLAERDYTHSTAPNRRYPDLITQRLLKAAVHRRSAPYRNEELSGLAKACTEKEDAARKVERQVRKSAAAILLHSRIGEAFDAVVTGAASKGTWVRVTAPPIEGRLVAGFEGADVGKKLRVQLVNTDVERGFIDFKRIGPP
ncbi:MAG TPA: RNB domain-containing ribonuclease [Candidatus Manganitrophaceae bacterium]|nr:RNB domain-containing ribonuclease [Candidatus Manganitrophaceae bacterium]